MHNLLFGIIVVCGICTAILYSVELYRSYSIPQAFASTAPINSRGNNQPVASDAMAANRSFAAGNRPLSLQSGNLAPSLTVNCVGGLPCGYWVIIANGLNGWLYIT